MSNAVSLVLPHQLFRNHPALEKGRPVYLLEEWLFFRQYRFHQMKLVLHRSSMKWYAHWLEEQGYRVSYVDAWDDRADCRKLIEWLAGKGCREIYVCDPSDNWLQQRIRVSCKKAGIRLQEIQSPNFIHSPADVEKYFHGKRHYHQADFYTWQRRESGLLMDEQGKPKGGKWSFDAENRERYPKDRKPPVLPLPKENPFIKEARQYVRQYFPDHYGDADAPAFFAVHFDDADRWLDTFLVQRFADFGKYEDAIVAEETALHHSVISPILNIGLLDPRDVISRAIEAADRYQVPLNSLEGFVRQVMGWREFVHIVYRREGSCQRTANFWGFSRKIPRGFWTGDTGVLPVDITVRKVLRTGYCHHIERLMVLGNFMLLCEFDPDEVYRWFMEMFIDAYDWVMVPNVYGMSMFADGGLMTTKPYMSGSNYLVKMGNYPKGDWQQTWDALFWRFMHVHRTFFAQNPRLGMLLGTLDKMSEEKRNGLLQRADAYLASLDRSIMERLDDNPGQ